MMDNHLNQYVKELYHYSPIRKKYGRISTGKWRMHPRFFSELLWQMPVSPLGSNVMDVAKDRWRLHGYPIIIDDRLLAVRLEELIPANG